MRETSLTLPRFLGLLLSVIFIWVFFFSIWYSNNILNEEKFVSTTTQVLMSESVRDSVSAEVVDRISQRRPILGAVTAPILTKVVSGVLATDLFSRVYERSARELHTQLTSKSPKSITIEIKPVKTFISKLVGERNPQILENAPDNLAIRGKR